jgi:hypothetical protein
MQSDISRLLKQRGYEVTKEGTEKDILLPSRGGPEVSDGFKAILYDLMRSDSIRRAFRDWAYDNVASESPSIQQIESYINLCQRLSDWCGPDDATKQGRYAATFEWYVSELLKRQFAARASGFGIRLKDASPEDEFDCVALIDSGVVFTECKTGKGDLYHEIIKFIRRDAELCADYSFFIFDRDYTFDRSKDDTPKISQKRASDLGIGSVAKVTVSNQHFFQIHGRTEKWAKGMGARYFLACTAFNGLESRIRYMFRFVNELKETGGPSSLFTVSPIPFGED